MDYASLRPEELARICAEGGTRQDWDEFIQRFNPLIARVILRTARRWNQFSPQLLDDLVQETYLKLCADNCRLLRVFESRQPDAFYGYLKTVTANIVHDHLKAAHAIKRGYGKAAESTEADENDIEQVADPRDSPVASMERTVLIQQIDQNLARIIPAEELARSRMIFWLYYRSGLSASSIAAVPEIGLTTKGVESAILRMTRALRAALVEPRKVPSEKSGDSSRHQKGITPGESF